MIEECLIIWYILINEQSKTYKIFKDLILSIFGDTIYEGPYDEKWFGMYDDEEKVLQIVHLLYSDAEKWISLANNYNQKFIEIGGYLLTNDMEVFKSERDRLESNYKILKKMRVMKKILDIMLVNSK